MQTIDSLDELQVEPGQVVEARFPVASLPDTSEVHLPLLVGQGTAPGPTLILTALIHGIEIGGYEVIRQVMREAVDFAQVRGRVVAVPVVNPLALGASSRFTPQDSADLNRVFPGSPNGSLSQRIAHTLMDRLVSQADYVIDFHSCNPPSLVFTIVNADGKAEVQEASWGMAEAFGSISVAPAGSIPGTFTGCVAELGKPVITPELVFSRRFEPLSADAGVRGTLNVMKHLGMLDGEPEAQPEGPGFQGRLLYTAYYTGQGGFVHLLKEVGDTVAEGEIFASIRNPWGEEVGEMRAPVTGLIIAFPMAGNQALTTGDKVAYFASAPTDS